MNSKLFVHSKLYIYEARNDQEQMIYKISMELLPEQDPEYFKSLLLYSYRNEYFYQQWLRRKNIILEFQTSLEILPEDLSFELKEEGTTNDFYMYRVEGYPAIYMSVVFNVNQYLCDHIIYQTKTKNVQDIDNKIKEKKEKVLKENSKKRRESLLENRRKFMQRYRDVRDPVILSLAVNEYDALNKFDWNFSDRRHIDQVSVSDFVFSRKLEYLTKLEDFSPIFHAISMLDYTYITFIQTSSDDFKKELSESEPIFGITPLMLCVSRKSRMSKVQTNKHVNMLKLLIKGGVDVNAIDKFGRTALMHIILARYYYRLESHLPGRSLMTDILINAGARIDIIDKTGRTLIDYYKMLKVGDGERFGERFDSVKHIQKRIMDAKKAEILLLKNPKLNKDVVNGISSFMIC